MDDEDFANLFATWPRVPLNRNQSEKEIFANYFSIIDKNTLSIQMLNLTNDEIVKNKEDAKEVREKGNICYKHREYEEALKLYNKSVCLAPRDSADFGLAVANRSAVLFDMEKYKECLEDIHLVLKSEYPKDLLLKIYLRQSRCFIKLNNNFDAAKYLRKAEEFVNKQKLNKTQKSLNKDKIMEIKNELKQQLEKNVTDNQSTEIYSINEPVLKDGENPNFSNASNLVEYRNTKKCGRHVVAKTEIKKGDILFVEEPYICIPSNRASKNSDMCANCFKRVLNIVPCTNCITYVYCSDKCRQESWDLGHRWTCLSEKQNIISNYRHFFALAMLFKASRDGFQSTTTNKNKDSNAGINQLLTNKDKLPDFVINIDVQFCVWLVKYLKICTDYFDWLYLQPNRPEGSKEDLYIFVGGQLLKFFLLGRRNAIVISEKKVLYTPIKFMELHYIPTGYGLFASTALLNHSCVPNTAQSFYGTKIVIRALSNIKKGTEITRNYLLHEYYFQTNEQRQLNLTKYMITCTCPACTDLNFLKKQVPWLCSQCGGKAYTNNFLFVKCVDCNLVGNLMNYIRNENEIQKLFDFFDVVNNEKLMDTVQQLIKKTYHKENLKYYIFYNKYVNNTKDSGGVKKYLTAVRHMKDLCGHLFQIDNNYLLRFFDYTFCVTNYCVFLKKFKSKNYKKHYDEALKAIEECEDIMQYLLDPNEVRKVVNDLKQYLNSDSIEIENSNFMLEELE